MRPLRMQDLEFGMNQIVVRDGKGAKDRVTALPAVAKAALAEHRQPIPTSSTAAPAASRAPPTASSSP